MDGEKVSSHFKFNAGESVSESQRDWDDRLPVVLAAYRASPHESTGFTPNRLFLGREVRMPLDLLLDLPEDERPMSCLWMILLGNSRNTPLILTR